MDDYYSTTVKLDNRRVREYGVLTKHIAHHFLLLVGIKIEGKNTKCKSNLHPSCILSASIIQLYNKCKRMDICLYQSTMFQVCRDWSSWVEPVLSKDKCVLLKDTTQYSDAGEAEPRSLSVSSQALYQ